MSIFWQNSVFFKEGSNLEFFLAGNILFHMAPLNLLKINNIPSITTTLIVLSDTATLEVYGCPEKLHW